MSSGVNRLALAAVQAGKKKGGKGDMAALDARIKSPSSAPSNYPVKAKKRK